MKAGSPLITVIVPVYKTEEYLHKCVGSILGQTYKNLEVILVDDGSPDGCGAICDEYAAKDSRVTAVHKANGGLSDARNAGLSIAKGEYIGFVDSDDYCKPDMYEKLYKAIRSSSADLAICDYRHIDEAGKKITDHVSMFSKKTRRPLENKAMTKYEAFQALCDRGNGAVYVTAFNKLYKTSLLNGKDKVSFPIGKIHEDEFVIHRIIDRCKSIVTIKDELYRYVRHDKSITAAFSMKRFECSLAKLERAAFFLREGYKALAFKTFFNAGCNAFYVTRKLIAQKMGGRNELINKGLQSLKNNGLRSTIKEVKNWNTRAMFIRMMNRQINSKKRAATCRAIKEKYAYLEERFRVLDKYNEPLVSIVAPSYNHEKYIKDCLWSVADQTYSNKELIIVDDRSGDQTAQIIAEIVEKPSFMAKFRNIRFIRHEKNAGAHNSINEGLRLADGEYLTVINTDDMYEPDRLKTIVSRMAESKSDIAFSKIKVIDEDGTIIPPSEDEPVGKNADFVYRFNGFALEYPAVSQALIYKNVAISTGNMVFCNWLFRELGGFCGFLHIHDWDFILRACLITEPLFVRDTAYLYRMHGSNTSAKLDETNTAGRECDELFRRMIALSKNKMRKVKNK